MWPTAVTWAILSISCVIFLVSYVSCLKKLPELMIGPREWTRIWTKVDAPDYKPYAWTGWRLCSATSCQDALTAWFNRLPFGPTGETGRFPSTKLEHASGYIGTSVTIDFP